VTTMRGFAFGSIVAVLVSAASHALAETLYWNWQGIRTCSGPGAYASHETEWMGRTNGSDNRGDTWSSSRWQDTTTTTVTPLER
jgi:hypothetical protein